MTVDRGRTTRRRHRADLTGYTIEFVGTDDPDRMEAACHALAKEFLAWRIRTGRARSPENGNAGAGREKP